MLPTDFPSSRAQTVTVSGVATDAVIGPAVIPSGPAPSGPSFANFNAGGVFPDPASPSSASICQLRCSDPGIAYVSPRIFNVQVTVLSPKSAGTLTANTPQCRPV